MGCRQEAEETSTRTDEHTKMVNQFLGKPEHDAGRKLLVNVVGRKPLIMLRELQS